MTISISILSKIRRITLFLLLVTFVFSTTSRAETNVLDEFKPIKQKLLDDGIKVSTVNQYFSDSRFEIIPSLLKVNIRQPSGTAGYQRFLGDESVQTASRFLNLNRAVFEEVVEGTRVEPEVVVAILNVESSLGKYKGTYPLMNVFASLTILDSPTLLNHAPDFWDKILEDIPETEHSATRTKATKRSKSKARWAYRQLKALMIMAEEGKLDPLDAKGSWAGAYGLPQFLPTSAQAYGRDGDGDGDVQLDVLHDAIASVANYLRIHGYRIDNPKKRRKAVWHYNHSDEYVDCVLGLADKIKEYNKTSRN